MTSEHLRIVELMFVRLKPCSPMSFFREDKTLSLDQDDYEPTMSGSNANANIARATLHCTNQ